MSLVTINISTTIYDLYVTVSRIFNNIKAENTSGVDSVFKCGHKMNIIGKSY